MILNNSFPGHQVLQKRSPFASLLGAHLLQVRRRGGEAPWHHDDGG
jgi:hypothetical protein